MPFDSNLTIVSPDVGEGCPFPMDAELLLALGTFGIGFTAAVAVLTKQAWDRYSAKYVPTFFASSKEPKNKELKEALMAYRQLLAAQGVEREQIKSLLNHLIEQGNTLHQSIYEQLEHFVEVQKERFKDTDCEASYQSIAIGELCHTLENALKQYPGLSDTPNKTKDEIWTAYQERQSHHVQVMHMAFTVFERVVEQRSALEQSLSELNSLRV